MYPARLLHRVLPLLLWLVLLASPALAADAVVTGVRSGQHPNATRFVVDLTAAVPYTVHTIADPYRVVIDLPELKWRIPADPPGVVQGVITAFRFGRLATGTSRIVLDMTGPVRIARTFALPPQGAHPHRLIIDLAPVDAATFRDQSATVNGAEMATVPVPAKRPPAPNTGAKRTVVIDPGHGGVDPGAISASGVYEKDVTLVVALELRNRLKATGRYRVALTRERDAFVKLRDRVASARSVAGDLFISLHADSIHNRRLRGASVYTLSETASDEEAAALADRENRADIIAGVDLSDESDVVSGILIDLAQRETMNRSAEFANLLVVEIGNAAKLLRKSRRFAGFAVLKAPDMPSVLVELGYLSNREDEQMLATRNQRARLIGAIIKGIDAYFETAAPR